eukprot:jgi/Chlat1/1110/Chrsp110S01551
MTVGQCVRLTSINLPVEAAVMGIRQLQIAVLCCERLQEVLPQAVLQRTGGYVELLQSCFDFVCANPSTSSLHREPPLPFKLNLHTFDAKEKEFPPQLNEFDGFLVTGSLSGVYQQDDWIQTLLERVRQLDQDKRKLCGISFGHQAVAQALGGQVAPNPKGSEVGVRMATFTDLGRRYFRERNIGPDMLLGRGFRLHYHHNDAILQMPAGLKSLATNNVTDVQAMAKSDHILTFSGHPDYSHTPEVLLNLLEGYDRTNRLVPEQMIQETVKKMTKLPDTDYVWVTRQIINFYAQKMMNE